MPRVTIVEERPDTEDALALLGELDAYLLALPYPPESRHAFSVEKLLREGVQFFVTRVDGLPAGCGGVKLYGAKTGAAGVLAEAGAEGEAYGEVKRMFVRPSARGLGLGKAILDRLAGCARSRGVVVLRLETGIYQVEAIGLYERWGFTRRGPFGAYCEDPNTVFFEKRVI